MAASNGGYDASEVVSLVTSDVAMNGFAFEDFVEPEYSRYEVYWLMIHDKPTSRLESFDSALDLYLQQGRNLAELALTASTTELDERKIHMNPAEMALQVGGLICASEAVAGYNLMHGWFDHINEEEKPKNYDKIDTVADAAIAINYHGFKDFLSMSEAEPTSTLLFWEAMRTSVNLALMGTLQRFERTISSFADEV